MRFYSFGNYYLSSLQQGLQAAHGVGDILTSFDFDSEGFSQAYNWAKNHKTIVLLNGGNNASLHNTHEFFKMLSTEGMEFPFVKFHEDDASLNGTLTCVGIVLSAKIYDMAANIRFGMNSMTDLIKNNDWQEWELKLISHLNNFNLAI